MEVIDRTIPTRLTPGTAQALRGRTLSLRKSRVVLEMWKPVIPKRFRLRRLDASRPGVIHTEAADFSAGLRAGVVGVTASVSPHVGFGIDPFEQALANAEWDDEPFTDEERIAVEAGIAAYGRGEFMPLLDVLEWLDDEGIGSVTAS